MRGIKLVAILLGTIVVAGVVYWVGKPEALVVPNMEIRVVPTTSSTVDYTASFEITTLGTKRIFTDPKYHNQNSDVYIQNPDPSVIFVKKGGVTWADFFNTLPFSLTETCLVTGTKQTFCNSETYKLRFYLNDQESSGVLSLEINPGDRLQVVYGK